MKAVIWGLAMQGGTMVPVDAPTQEALLHQATPAVAQHDQIRRSPVFVNFCMEMHLAPAFPKPPERLSLRDLFVKGPTASLSWEPSQLKVVAKNEIPAHRVDALAMRSIAWRV